MVLLATGFIEVFAEDFDKVPVKMIKFFAGAIHSLLDCGGLQWLVNESTVVATDG